jgi:alkylation response protein AidB-like acyl-CoA dehydrogenase
MNFDFSEEQKLLQKASRDFLEANCTLARVREIFESDLPYDEALWKGAAEMGWQGAALPESVGGAGFGYLELALVAEEVGRAIAAIPFAPSVYLATEALLLADDAAINARYLPGLASGDCIGTFALAERVGQSGASNVETTLSRGKLTGRKVAVPYGDVADIAVVVAKQQGKVVPVLVELTGAGIKRHAVESFDPAVSQATIEFEAAPAKRLGKLAEGQGLIEDVRDRAAILLAFEQLGSAQRCLDIGIEFARQRYAFGRPIASFQAIKHKLADMFTAVELARSNCYYGAWALSTNSEELPVAACLARISASEAFQFCAEENLQIHGGVGFTWEYDCHLFLRRAMLQGSMLGTARDWKRALIRRLARSSVQ